MNNGGNNFLLTPSIIYLVICTEVMVRLRSYRIEYPLNVFILTKSYYDRTQVVYDMRSNSSYKTM